MYVSSNGALLLLSQARSAKISPDGSLLFNPPMAWGVFYAIVFSSQEMNVLNSELLWRKRWNFSFKLLMDFKICATMGMVLKRKRKVLNGLIDSYGVSNTRCHLNPTRALPFALLLAHRSIKAVL